MRKLNDEMVRQIMEDIKSGECCSINQICQKYDISHRFAQHIFAGDVWKHVTSEYNFDELAYRVIHYPMEKLDIDTIENILVEVYAGVYNHINEISIKYHISPERIRDVLTGIKSTKITSDLKISLDELVKYGGIKLY